MADRNELHPVRFTHRQISFIKHVMDHSYEYFEEDAGALLETIEDSEEGMSEEEKELSR